MNSTRFGRLVFACGLALSVGAPLRADSDGLPRLDPSNGTTGTDYDFVMPVAARSMDPGELGFSRTFRGTFTLSQNAGEGDFDITSMEVDTDGDGQPDRTLACDGRVGRGRFGIRCSEDDGLGDIRLVIAGRAAILTGGRLALRRATGRGFTESQVLALGFSALSQ